MGCDGCGKNTVIRAVGAIGKGAMGIAKALLGTDPVTEEVRQQRIAICKACEHAAPGVIHRDKKVYCGKLWSGLFRDKDTCGCVLELKVLNASSSCPLGKWSAANNSDREA